MKSSAEFVHERQKEIIDACEKLYQTMSFKDITIIEIGKVTSFTRTSIYNYFNTKEEIFLALLQREYEFWIQDLEKIISDNENLSKENFADLIAKSLENRKQLLKLLSMNLFDMEMNSRQENLIDFKKASFLKGEFVLCRKYLQNLLRKDAKKLFPRAKNFISR